jgi:hypothetical protein
MRSFEPLVPSFFRGLVDPIKLTLAHATEIQRGRIRNRPCGHHETQKNAFETCDIRYRNQAHHKQQGQLGARNPPLANVMEANKSSCWLLMLFWGCLSLHSNEDASATMFWV